MKVKVTYTVDYDDVPKLVNEMLNDCRAKLKSFSDFKFDFFRLDDTTTEIRKVNEGLDLIATQLEDCMNLCRGYAEVVSNPAEDVSHDHMEKLRELDEKIATVKSFQENEVGSD